MFELCSTASVICLSLPCSCLRRGAPFTSRGQPWLPTCSYFLIDTRTLAHYLLGYFYIYYSTGMKEKEEFLFCTFTITLVHWLQHFHHKSTNTTSKYTVQRYSRTHLNGSPHIYVSGGNSDVTFSIAGRVASNVLNFNCPS